MNINFEAFKKALSEFESFIISGHEDPDGDSLGSALALESFLKRQGKTVYLCSAGPFIRPESKRYERFFLPTIPLEASPNSTALILVDCAAIERTALPSEKLATFKKIVIDHHHSSFEDKTDEAFFFIDPNSPSTTLLIHQLILSMGEVPTEEEAEMIFWGFCTDTDFFRHLPAGKGDVFHQVAQLCESGISPQKMFRKITPQNELDSQILTGRILARTTSHYNGQLLVSYELVKDRKDLHLETRDSKKLYETLFATEGCKAVVLIRGKENGDCSVGLRSIDDIDVTKIANQFSGGGHKNASGCLVEESPVPEAVDLIVEAFQALF